MMKLLLPRRELLAATLALGAGAARAQAFPSRPVAFIVPYPAGGPADATARQMEPALRKALGQPLVIDNIAGDSGALGVQRLLAAPTDGHHIMMGTSSDVILAPLALAAVKHRPEQLRLLGMASRAPLLLVGGARGRSLTFDELLALARGSKGLSYGSIGLGSLYHLAGEDFASRLLLNMTHVPYKGVAPLVQDLIGGQMDIAFLPSAGNLPELVAQGRLKAHALADGRRLTRLPDVPTLAEVAGLGDFEYEIWGGVFVLRSVPAEAAQQLNAAVNDALRDPEYRRQIEAAGSLPGTPMSLDDADRFLAAQVIRCRRIAQAVKLHPQ